MGAADLSCNTSAQVPGGFSRRAVPDGILAQAALRCPREYDTHYDIENYDPHASSEDLAADVDALADLLFDADDAALARAGRLVKPSETVESLASWAASASIVGSPTVVGVLDPSEAPETARLIDEFCSMLDHADSPRTHVSDTTVFQMPGAPARAPAPAQASNATDAPVSLSLKALPLPAPHQPTTNSRLGAQGQSAVHAFTPSLPNPTASFHSITPNSSTITTTDVNDVHQGSWNSFSSAAEYRRHVAIPRYMRKRKNRQWDSVSACSSAPSLHLASLAIPLTPLSCWHLPIQTPLYSTRTDAANRRVRKNGRFKKRTSSFVSVTEMSRLQDSDDEAAAAPAVATPQPMTSALALTSAPVTAAPLVAEVPVAAASFVAEVPVTVTAAPLVAEV